MRIRTGSMFKQIMFIFVTSRALVIYSALIGAMVVEWRSPMEGELLWNIEIPFFNLFARWDSCYYLVIAREGYISDAHWSFRPFFPVILKVLSALLSVNTDFDASATLMGFLANNLFFMIALILIYKLTCIIQSEEAAFAAALLAAFYPTAVFYSAIYAESLYLLILTACFYALEKGKILTSGCLGFLAGLTRPEGFLASLVIILKGLKTQGSHAKLKTVASAAVAALSIPAFLSYANMVTGGFQVVFHAEMQWDKLTLRKLIEELFQFQTALSPQIVGHLLISLPMMFIGLVAVFSFFVKNRSSSVLRLRLFPYYLFSATLMIVYLAQGDVRAIPRLFSTEIPIYWTLSLWMTKIYYVKAIIIALFVSLLPLGTVLFVNWYHFF